MLSEQPAVTTRRPLQRRGLKLKDVSSNPKPMQPPQTVHNRPRLRPLVLPASDAALIASRSNVRNHVVILCGTVCPMLCGKMPVSWIPSLPTDPLPKTSASDVCLHHTLQPNRSAHVMNGANHPA